MAAWDFVEALRGVLGRRGHGYCMLNWLIARCRRFILHRRIDALDQEGAARRRELASPQKEYV
jgi:hypothetical protein